MATQVAIPTLAERRAALSSVVSRFQAEMARSPFTEEQIARYRTAYREKARYHHAKLILDYPEFQIPFTVEQIRQMQAFVADIEADPERLDVLERLERIGARIQRYLDMKRYLEKGPSSMDDARLQTYLDMKRAQTFMRHDPIDAFPEARVAPDCPNEHYYGVLFDGLELAEARSFCARAEGDPKTALKRRYRFRFAQLPAVARQSILQRVVPRVAWNPAYMELKGG